ncbi:hypothetical protein [Polyangium aurulentum]|uniref:hypothetical protein n=1 Tax=Polyangium aurulentum TaxID=2567896 RepID=UPI001F333A27|nr:hypothetical protein [Polyangium aurulentum]
MPTPRLATPLALALLALSCASAPPPAAPVPDAKPAPAKEAAVSVDENAANKSDAASVKALAPKVTAAVLDKLSREGALAAAPEAIKARVERGVTQVAAAWRAEDGGPEAFEELCVRWFVADPKARDGLLDRFASVFEQMDGHLLEIGRALRSWNELEYGPEQPIDAMFAAFDVGAHVPEDLFKSKIAFVVLLNFPLVPIDEMAQKGRSWSRRDWAAARLARRFALRPSGAALQARAEASAASEAYIAGYNLWMHHVLAPGGKRLFPKGMRLITHWNLRDQIRAEYAEGDGLARQRVIRRAMERIVAQDIPKAVIDDPRVDWDPFDNTVRLAPPEVTETPRPEQGKRAAQPSASAEREPDTRYAMLLGTFRAARQLDRDSPMAPTEIARRFQLDSELPEARVESLLRAVVSSPLAARVGKLVEKRLGRPLEPHDIWYAGFMPRATFSEEKLSEITRKKYPTHEAYKKDMPRLLEALGFSKEKAKWLDARIAVDPSRGAGHALEAGRRTNLHPSWGGGDFPHLRTRVATGGMDYKGYNIAVHEMGHSVEQVFSLYGVDSTLMQGVPGAAFTEALAFTFQHRDLELLGLQKPDARSERLRVLDSFWSTWEIAGVALVDLGVWRFMYAHPEATPAELREATVKIATELWDQFYAPIVGGKGSPLLAIYSHMISSFFYLPHYPLGHIIAFQLEEKLKGLGTGAEFERMCTIGRVLPDLWMENATGKPVSAEPLLDATSRAVAAEETGGR